MSNAPFDTLRRASIFCEIMQHENGHKGKERKGKEGKGKKGKEGKERERIEEITTIPPPDTSNSHPLRARMMLVDYQDSTI